LNTGYAMVCWGYNSFAVARNHGGRPRCHGGPASDFRPPPAQMQRCDRSVALSQVAAVRCRRLLAFAVVGPLLHTDAFTTAARAGEGLHRRLAQRVGCPFLDLDTRNHPAPEQGWGRLTSRGRGPSRGSGRGHPGGPGPSRRARASGPRRGGRRRKSCRRGSGPSPS
jgi:hypothetical protein